MTIITFDKTAVINYDFVADIHIKEKDDVGRYKITADYGNNVTARGGAMTLGVYKNKEYCKYALEKFIAAIRNGDVSFDFPNEAEIDECMRAAKQSGVQVKTKANRHGGS